MIDFKLKGVDEKEYSVASFKDKKFLVIVFTCNHCPYAQASWPRLIELQKEFASRDIQFVGINPNDDRKYPDDSFSNMKLLAKEKSVNFPYLRDASQEVARAYQAQCTPDVYVYDRARQLKYHGRMDDNWQEPTKVKSHDLKNALETLLQGKVPSEKQMPSMGCSIKWK
ncbi:MAG: thioredoxin family protein [Chlamydiae bacterium]|nr:thioredoxin family protein [Chlamydiota bacterium]